MTAAAEWDDLAHLAEAATSGEWEARRDSGCSWIAASSDEDPTVIADYLTVADAEFIAAANPTTILRLIGQLRGEERKARGFAYDLRIAEAFSDKRAQEIDRLRAERDELAAKVARVEALADETEQAGDPLLRLDRLRAALSAAPTDTTQEQA